MKLRIREDRFKTKTTEPYLSLFYVQMYKDDAWYHVDLIPFVSLEEAKAHCNKLMNPPPIVKPIVVIHDYP